MKTYEKHIVINLLDPQKLKVFCSIIRNKDDVDVTVSSGRYVVNGKSIIGLMSLYLVNDLNCVIECDDITEINNICELMSSYDIIIE